MKSWPPPTRGKSGSGQYGCRSEEGGRTFYSLGSHERGTREDQRAKESQKAQHKQGAPHLTRCVGRSSSFRGLYVVLVVEYDRRLRARMQGESRGVQRRGSAKRMGEFCLALRSAERLAVQLQPMHPGFRAPLPKSHIF